MRDLYQMALGAIEGNPAVAFWVIVILAIVAVVF